MIRSFKHKGLEKFFTKGTNPGIQSGHSKRLQLILGRLNASITAQDMNLPGLHLHQLRGKHRARWSVRVSGNWRITFKFDGPDAIEIDYEDYH